MYFICLIIVYIIDPDTNLAWFRVWQRRTWTRTRPFIIAGGFNLKLEESLSNTVFKESRLKGLNSERSWTFRPEHQPFSILNLYGIPHVNDQHHRWAPCRAALASVMYLNDSDYWLISSMDRLFTSHIIVNNDGEYFFPIQYSVSIHSMCLFSWLITGRYTPIYRGSLQSWRLPHPSIDMTLLQWEVCVQNRTYARQSLDGPMSK